MMGLSPAHLKVALFGAASLLVQNPLIVEAGETQLQFLDSAY
jgi:hypothetical protein